MIVDIFVPCFVDQIYAETAKNMVKILEKLDIGVHYNPNQTCCGQMAFNSGYWEEAKAIGEKLIHDFPNDRYIIGPSASCVGYIRNYFPKLFHNTSLHNDFKQVRKNMYEFSDFLVNVLHVSDLGAKLEMTACYHDACAALREYGIKNEPRTLLNQVRGLELVEMKENNVCCGFGGTFSVKNEAISTAMAQQKIKHAIASGAECIISTEASCLMHLSSYIEQQNLPMKTMHLIDVLAQGWE